MPESTDAQSSGALYLNSRGPETRCKPRLGIGTLRGMRGRPHPLFTRFSALHSVTPYGSRSRISHVVHKSTGTLPRVTARRETKRRHDAKIAARPTTRRPVACLAKREDAAGRRRRRRLGGIQRPETEAVNWTTSMTSWMACFFSRGQSSGAGSSVVSHSQGGNIDGRRRNFVGSRCKCIIYQIPFAKPGTPHTSPSLATSTLGTWGGRWRRNK